MACCFLFLALKALSAAFSGVFSTYFFFPRGNRWNPIDMKLIPIWCWLSEDEVFATNAFSLEHSLVCRVPGTHGRNPLVSPPGSEFLLFFSLICNNLKIIYEKTLSLYAFHFCLSSQQQCIKPSLLSPVNSSLDTVCLA